MKFTKTFKVKGIEFDMQSNYDEGNYDVGTPQRDRNWITMIFNSHEIQFQFSGCVASPVVEDVDLPFVLSCYLTDAQSVADSNFSVEQFIKYVNMDNSDDVLKGVELYTYSQGVYELLQSCGLTDRIISDLIQDLAENYDC